MLQDVQIGKSGSKICNIPPSYPLGLIMLLCLSFCPETANAYPKATPIITPQLVAQTNPQTQAQQLFDEGMQLFNQGTAESLQQAIVKWEAALPLWREVGDKASEAVTLLGIGRVYDALGEKQKAARPPNRAIPQ
jgi:hypothetical protein